MMSLILAVLIASTPVQPDFQCGMEDSACWRRMVLWEYNHRIAAEHGLDDAQRALKQEQVKNDGPTRPAVFGWGVAAGLALAIGGYLVFHH